MTDLMELMAILVVLLSLISWPIIFIGKWIHRIRGKCPETRFCFDITCPWRPWCKRFVTIGNSVEHVRRMLAERRKQDKKLEREQKREQKRKQKQEQKDEQKQEQKIIE